MSDYILALKYDFLTPLYDLIIRALLPEAAFKSRLVEQCRLAQGHRVLDLGCGTGTLTLMIKRKHPEAEVVGIDGDPKIIEIAKKKISKAGVPVGLDVGMAFALPYADRSFDRVVSSLVLHHLTHEDKQRTLREVYRVLRSGGEFHVADWGKPEGRLLRFGSRLEQHFDGHVQLADNLEGRLPEMFREGGFSDVEETARYKTVVGVLCLHRARKD
jgi:ubiquinone/menaquinone biosynthesis C-methylase UbiE